MADERKRSARFKRPLKRLVSCGTCKACTRAECGNCINCLDKLKFGGQGIRKQCCINRRCLKLKQHVAPLQPQNQQDDDKTQDLEQQLFWTAVAGCMKLTGEAYDVSEHSSPAAERKSDDAADEQSKDGKLERPSHKGLPLSGDESTFCFKLASLLASDGTLASKPIAVRLMSSPQMQSQQSGSLELPRLSLLHSTSSGGMHDLNALRASLSLGVS